SITVIFGGGFLTAVVSFVISALVDRIGRLLNHYSLPFFFQQVAGGLFATLAASAVVNIGILPTESPQLVAAAAITVLLSGLGTVSAVQDAITGYNVTAAGRTLEVAMMSVGLIAGVTLGIRIAAFFEPAQSLGEAFATTALDLPKMLFAGAGAAGCFALASYARLRSVLVASAAGAVGAITYGLLRFITTDQIVASVVAATLVGFAGGVMARRLRVTPLVVAVSGITPLLPGLLTYRGLSQLL